MSNSERLERARAARIRSVELLEQVEKLLADSTADATADAGGGIVAQKPWGFGLSVLFLAGLVAGSACTWAAMAAR